MTLDERDALAVAALPAVRRIAVRIARRTPPNVDLEDLYAVGALAVVEAARRFEPERGAAFATFAYVRAYGAMLDSLRAEDVLTRAERRAARGAGESGDRSVPIAAVEEQLVERRTPEDDATAAEAWRLVARLPEVQRRAVELVLVEGMGLTEAGRLLGRSPAAIHQARVRAIANLRAMTGRAA